MSLSSMPVSLCVIRIELENTTTKENADVSVVQKMRGFRDLRDIDIESFFGSSQKLVSLLNFEEGENSEKKNRSEKTIEILHDFQHSPFKENAQGILHLFKENEMTEMHCAADRSLTVCILSIPATMTNDDIINFTAAFHKDIQNFRIIRANNLNQYITLITFKNSGSASEFYKSFNGVPYYGSIPLDVVCHLVFVSKIEITDNGLPLSGHTELPFCPVCLERMDESVDGILTISRNHFFQSNCGFDFGNETFCPICKLVRSNEPLSEKRCMQCGTDETTEDVWVCLICGHLGCSRYDSGHAFSHYHETRHCYALQLGNDRVWDYVRDNFVHRLMLNKDGKMVDSNQESTKSETPAVDEKIDSVQLEFTYLLTSQLETQRKYFEERLQKLRTSNCEEISELRKKVENVAKENSELKERTKQIRQQKQVLDKKLNFSSNKLCQVQKELGDEKELRNSLSLDQDSWHVKFEKMQSEAEKYEKTKSSEIQDLKEQVRDLMFFLEAQKQVENSADKEDIASGNVIIGEKEENASSERLGKKNRKKKNGGKV